MGVRIDAVDYAVVDVETTGLFPGRQDRVIEVAVLRYRPGGELVDRYVTLIDPGRDLGPTHVHGIEGYEVRGAPAFADLVGDLATRLCGAVLVAHNARFDGAFLRAEFRRAGHVLPWLPSLCTMTLAGRLGLVGAGRSLASACAAHGVHYDHDRAHGALHDAEAAAAVFGRLLVAAWRAGARTLGDLGCDDPLPPRSAWPAGRACSRTRTRRQARVARQERFGFLGRVARRAADRPGSSPDLAPYLDLLDRVLEDQVVSETEADALVALAHDWGFTAEQVERAHRDYLRGLVDAAWADGSVSEGERRELETVGFWLGLDRAAVHRLVDAAAAPRTPSAATARETLHGQSVCFTGQLRCTTGGQPLTRSAAHELAARAGLRIQDGVTRRLDLLVVADPDTRSGKALKGREYGVRIITEPVFWRAIGVAVD